MKTPHDPERYENTDADTASETPSTIATEPHDAQRDKSKRRGKNKLSGAYYYVDVDEKKLSEAAFIRTVLTVIALLLQVVILLLPAQASLEYVTTELASLALFYVVSVFVVLAISVWLAIMNATRYKFRKRIPVEYAPKNGFKRRAFFGAELYIAANALITVYEIVFVCVKYDPITLVAVFLSALATAAATGARQVTHLALRNAELIPAPDKKADDDK